MPRKIRKSRYDFNWIYHITVLQENFHHHCHSLVYPHNMHIWVLFDAIVLTLMTGYQFGFAPMKL